MANPRRRGDSDDEGAAPPVNHRQPPSSSGMSTSGTSHYSTISAPVGQRAMTGPLSSHRQQSALGASSSASISGLGSTHTSPGMIMRSSTSSSRYGLNLPKSTQLPSRWVLEDRDRALMGATSMERSTSFQLGYGPTGDPTCFMAIPQQQSSQQSSSSCLIVANHSIPVEHLKEVALKNTAGGDQPNGSFTGMDDASAGTIDQILSNLRSKPFGVSSAAKRATSASLYPTLPGERGGGPAPGGGHRDSTGSSFKPKGGDPSSPDRKTTTNNPVYYFEITVQALPPDAVVSIGMIVNEGSSSERNPNVPGEIKNSIGLTSKGELKVGGRTMDEKKYQDVEGFQAGDVIGCGLEVLGTRRILFTKNGKTMIQRTRFQDVEPKHNAYAPSVGIVVTSSKGSGISAVANFGAGQSFGWEEADLLNIVNSTLNHQYHGGAAAFGGGDDQKKPPAANSLKYPALNGHNISGGFLSSSHSPQQTQHVEQRSAPIYNFGKPSKRASGGLMAGDNNSISAAAVGARPASNRNPPPSYGAKVGKGMLDDDSDGHDDADNDINYNSNSFVSATDYNQGPQQNRQQRASLAGWPQGAIPIPPDETNSPVKTASPQRGSSRGRKNDPLSASPAAKSKGKDPGRSKSPRGLFSSFGRSSKKSGNDSVLPGSTSPTPSANSQQRKSASRSNSPVLFGTRRKKKKDGGLLDDDEDGIQGSRDIQPMPNAAAQEFPPARRQTPSTEGGANLYNSQNGHTRFNNGSSAAAAAPTTTAQPATSSSSGDVLFGRKSKKSSLDDDNPADVELQNQVSSSMSPARAPSSVSSANSGSVGAPLFGKKSKKSSLDDDNAADVQLQTTISNSFPAEITALQNEISAATGISQTSQNAPDSSVPLFGKKSKKSNLDNDSTQDVQLQSAFGNRTTSSENAQSATANSNPLFFGTKSRKSSLDDDNPEDSQIQDSFAQMANVLKKSTSGTGGTAGMPTGRPASGGTSGIAIGRPASGGVGGIAMGRPVSNSATGVTNGRPVSNSATGVTSGRPSSSGVAGGMATGRLYSGGASGVAMGRPASSGLPAGMAMGRPVSSGAGVGMPVGTPISGMPDSARPGNGARTSGLFGSKPKKSSLEDDDAGDGRYPSNMQLTFGSKSKKNSLEDDDPDDDRYQAHSNLPAGFNFGNPTKKNSLGDDEPNDDRYQSHASFNLGTRCKKNSLEDDNPDDFCYQGGAAQIAALPNSMPAPMPGSNTATSANSYRRQSNNPPRPQTAFFGSKPAKSSLEDDEESSDARQHAAGTPFGARSKKGSLEDDDANGSNYQSHGTMFGASGRNSFSENVEPNTGRYRSSPQGQAPSMHAFMQATSQQNPPHPSSGSRFNSRASAPEQRMRMSVPFQGGPSDSSRDHRMSLSTPGSTSGGLTSNMQTQQNRDRSNPSSRFFSNGGEKTSSLDPDPIPSNPEKESEEDMLNKAIEESKRDQKKQELKGQMADSGPLKDPAEIETIRENTRTLRSLCSDERVDASILESLLECCKDDRAKVQACLESDDPQVDLMELLTLNELVLDAIKMGEKVIEGSKKKASSTSRNSKTNLNLDIGALVEKKDIFSLICILRAQSDQRLDAALALMNFAKEVDSLAAGGPRSLRDEIRSSGGMHSLITVFRSKGASYELRVVSALAVAYVLPSFVESSSVHPSVGLKIMECLRFLSTSRLVTPNGRRISREEMYKAAAMGVTTFWINELTPMLNAGMPKGENNTVAERSDLFSRTSKKGRRKGRTGGQRHQTLELQELLEMTVSLIVQIERLGENEAYRKQSTQTDSLFMWRYTNVEQVCAVDVARPIAVREGLLPILVGWIRSKDREKVRPAVSALRYLTSIKDKYMAGWIHSQMVNEGALCEVVKLADDYYVGQDVRLAVAQILASLCVAPHTRAAVVEAKCINYLIGFLYDHSDKASQDVALFAGSAIMQLAEGAITRASVLGGGDTELQDGASPDKSDTLVDDIVNSGAIGSFIAIAADHEGKLRSMAIEAIRVLSEDTSPNRRTRSQLCEEGAAMALGRALKDGVTALHNTIKPSRRRNGFGAELSLDELHDALCALANILEPIQPGNATTTKLRFVPSNSDPTQNLIQGCIETAESGGLDSLLLISSLPLTGTRISDSAEFTVQRIDLLEEACRSLASLSPLLLSKEPAAQGYARCADSIFEAFDRILMLDPFDGADDDASDGTGEDHYEQEALLELNISALRGLGALATAEPLKIKIVDKTLPCLLQMRNSQGNRSDVSNVTGQVFLSLGFEEDEIAVQVAGSNPNLLADWFCLQRSLIIQAMARSEIRRMLLHIWKMPFFETKRDGVTRLIRETNVRKTDENKVSVDSFAESFAEIDLFESFADDDFTEHLRHTMVRQYHEFYNMGAPSRSTFACDDEHDEVSLLARHMYPLNDTQTEIDWILGHDESIYSKPKGESSLCTKVSTPEHVEALLDCCFPSRLLRNHVVPVFSLRPEATFNFRALTMPQRKYFSFRREGQLISRLCDKQAESLDFDDVHWTLGFMNSTFAGEFSETLVQALYLCPTIRGLSFGKNEDYAHLRALDGDDEYVEDGSASLANLVGSLPPWIHSLTFSNIFSDREVKTLVGIIETMGKLSSDQVAKASSMGGYASRGRDSSSAAQTQGKFFSFAICSSPRVSQEVWHSFFSLLGRANALPRKAASSPLSSLKVLDLSFNNLGDDTCSLLLELIHDPESGCSLEQLDLSGNGIRKGTRVLSTLRRYVEHHRFNASSGSMDERNGWRCSLQVLNLSANNLGVGKAAVEIVALLKHNALGLKTLDLSSNGFDPSNIEYELSHAIISSLTQNTILCTLNLSNNSFSPDLLDDFLTQLSESDADCGVAFLGLDNNTPPLSVLQENCLESFLNKSRRFVLQKCLNERDSVLSGELREPRVPDTGLDNNLGYQKSSDLSIIGESTVLANQESDFNKSAFDETEGQPGDNMITVLFSAPLVFTNERRQLKPFAKLDFDMERELMWQCMKEASRDIELFFDNATHDRLLAAITKRCSCLHYSGHGHPSYLPFEDGGGGPNWFKVEDIQRLIAREGAAPFKFVFVSACHSGLAGETFASAGVPHVVCCQQEFELKDTAALAFTRQFYLSLVIGHTVRESFEQGCKAVRATPNLRDSEKEMKKFLLLPKDGNHDVPIFNARPVLEWPKVNARQLMRSRSSKRPKSITRIRNLHVGGARSSELGVRNMMQEDPSPTPPQFFLGREVEMYYVLKAILCKRLVSVVAEPGLGRSSLVCALCHYINERASTIIAIERIYFVKAKRSRRVDGCRALMEQLLRKLVEAGKEDPPDPGVDMEDLFDFICKALKNEKALVVFDRMEYLENSDDAEEFPMLLSTLFRGTKNVKVLVTGSRPLGIPSLGGQVEYPFPLGPLTFENTLRLFANLCPHLHTAGERHKLFERLATDGEQSELRPADNGITDRTKAIFKIVGDGIPSRIEQAAYDISKNVLEDLLDRYG